MANHLSGRDEAFNSSARSTQQADSTGNRDHPNQPVPRGNLRTLPLIATLEDTVTDDFYLDQNLIWQRRRPRTAEHQYNSVEASDPPHQEAVSPATSPPFAGSPHSLPPFTYLQLPPESLLPPGLVRRRIRSSLFDPTLPVARETTSPVARETIIPVAREMPYNNAAIPPPEEISGSASLPLARVKKILNIDEDTHQVSNNAAFVITIATEMLIRYLAEQALNVVKAEKKPRRNIQYKDLATAVARIDNLQFLEDVIPQTMTYREYKAKRASKVTKAPQPLQNGQTTLDGARSLPERPLETTDPQKGPTEDATMSDGTVDEQASEAQRPESSKASGGGLVFEHYEPNGTSKKDDSGDVEMG